MFIFVPLFIIVGSILGIALIVWRKKPYLDKLHILDVAGSGTDGTGSVTVFGWRRLGEELFPELKSLLEKSKLYEYRAAWLKELEKLLRRTRLVSLRMDRFSDSLIKRIRRVNLNGQLSISKEEGIGTGVNTMPEKASDQTSKLEKGATNQVFLRNEEQRLIMEIAKNPKDGKLYEGLGDLYVEMSNFLDAKESYEAAIELNPQDEALKSKLSGTLEKASADVSKV